MGSTIIRYTLIICDETPQYLYAENMGRQISPGIIWVDEKMTE